MGEPQESQQPKWLNLSASNSARTPIVVNSAHIVSMERRTSDTVLTLAGGAPTFVLETPDWILAALEEEALEVVLEE